MWRPWRGARLRLEHSPPAATAPPCQCSTTGCVAWPPPAPSQFNIQLDILEDYLGLRGYKYSRLDGSTNRVQRMIDIKVRRGPPRRAPAGGRLAPPTRRSLFAPEG